MQAAVEVEALQVPQVPAALEEVEPDLFLEQVQPEVLIPAVEVVAVTMLLVVQQAVPV
jgi:hypothetical protein